MVNCHFRITVFKFSGTGGTEEEEAVKDSLVFHGVPKDTMEENLQMNLML